jgi:methyltransferase (TIGR00027 family)
LAHTLRASGRLEHVEEGQASITAQRVAAHRLTFERVSADYGDPDADERLARDVAGSVDVAGGGMSRYLAARTAFFDRVVVRAIDGGMSQVVIAAAGYDGRALRYARPGVAWFEVDHPDTQRDKRERLTRLGIETDRLTFVAADFNHDDVAAGLHTAGHDRERPSLFLVEGVAVYLERDVLASLLRGLRAAAAPTSRLAISVSVERNDGDLAARRAAFASAVATMGEPARTVLTADEAAELFEATGWIETATANHRARLVGLVVLQPV